MACADALRPAKHNPKATPAHSSQPAIKLRRDVVSVAFPLAEASSELRTLHAVSNFPPQSEWNCYIAVTTPKGVEVIKLPKGISLLNWESIERAFF